MRQATLKGFGAWRQVLLWMVAGSALCAADGPTPITQEPLWSLRPFASQPVPPVAHLEWPRSRVDFFILAKLEQNQLVPNADADGATLLRRVFFDLTGLPPSVDEVDAFETAFAGRDPAALAAVVDRLLASPEFGVRWGRHWLDVARFAESAGNTRNMSYPEAWRYRNYVIRAFNRGVPFDEFIREQLAGDLLPAVNPTLRDEHLLATGFLNVGVKTLGEMDKLQYELNVADDQIDATCRAFLALTVNCARCHDHKFDPIPTADYYALAGIFRSTQNLAGVETNNVQMDAGVMPLGMDGRARMENVKQHAQKLSEMKKEYVEVAKRRTTMRDELVKAGVQPEKAETRIDTMPKEMAEKLTTLVTLDKSVEEFKAKIKTMQDSMPVPPPVAMAVQEKEQPVNCPVFDKGEVKKPLAAVPRGVLGAVPVRFSAVGPKESGRRQLAEWIVDGKNPLTARVIVNRVWQHLFGRGLVETPDNFGSMGARPSHPELLDDLAARFVREGWSVKKMIRELVLSRAYQLSSENSAAGTKADAENVLLWRANRKRLEAEPLRDAMLALSGDLDHRPLEGSPVADLSKPLNPQQREVARNNFLTGDLSHSDVDRHRSIYLPVVRAAQRPMLQCFNAADPSMVSGVRATNIVPAQALVLMNSSFVMEQAQGFARRLLRGRGSMEDRVIQAWRMAFARRPDAAEKRALMQALGSTADKEDGWAQVCQVLFQCGEFQILY
jgi:hypothetical protein